MTIAPRGEIVFVAWVLGRINCRPFYGMVLMPCLAAVGTSKGAASAPVELDDPLRRRVGACLAVGSTAARRTPRATGCHPYGGYASRVMFAKCVFSSICHRTARSGAGLHLISPPFSLERSILQCPPRRNSTSARERSGTSWSRWLDDGDDDGSVICAAEVGACRTRGREPYCARVSSQRPRLARRSWGSGGSVVPLRLSYPICSSWRRACAGGHAPHLVCKVRRVCIRSRVQMLRRNGRHTENSWSLRIAIRSVGSIAAGEMASCGLAA